jgi:hypothetical protein
MVSAPARSQIPIGGRHFKIGISPSKPNVGGFHLPVAARAESIELTAPPNARSLRKKRGVEIRKAEMNFGDTPTPIHNKFAKRRSPRAGFFIWLRHMTKKSKTKRLADALLADRNRETPETRIVPHALCARRAW